MQTATIGVREVLTDHAEERMYRRGLSPEMIGAALRFGRQVHTRGACIHAIGRREVERYRQLGIDLEDCHGLQVVCGPDGQVITVYRNRDFRGLRPRRRRRRHGWRV